MTDKELALEICAEIRAAHSKLCLPYHLEAGEPGITDSKVGGMPYLPKGEEWPVDGRGVSMAFLAQIDCTQLSALPDFPHTGLLQFFIGADDVYGMDFDHMTNQDGFRVIYRETAPPADAVDARVLPTPPEAYYTPLGDKPCRVVFGSVQKQGVPDSDFLFQSLFLKQWNQRRPEKPLKSIWDFYRLFPKEERDYAIFDEEDEDDGYAHHQLDGYPFFTQTDPRIEVERYSEFDTLLFQLDSDRGTGPHDLVLWGDCGVGNFFINREALKRRDFSKVLYNWDCC